MAGDKYLMAAVGCPESKGGTAGFGKGLCLWKWRGASLSFFYRSVQPQWAGWTLCI